MTEFWRRRSFLGWTAAFGAALLTRPAMAMVQPMLAPCDGPVYFRHNAEWMPICAIYVIKGGQLELNWPGEPSCLMTNLEGGMVLNIRAASFGPRTTAEVARLA